MRKAWLTGLSLLISHSGWATQPMVHVPVGTYTPFLKGAQKAVHVDAFEMDPYPVTKQEFAAFVKSHPEWKKSRVLPIFSDLHYLESWRSDLNPGSKEANQQPVTEVSWFAAKSYCESEGKELPATDQWEYAAAEENFGQAAQTRNRILAWYSRPNDKAGARVGSTPPDRFGIYDLHGLIWEWTQDFNSDFVDADSNLFCGNASQGATDPSDYAKFMRYSFRSSLKANYATGNLGFRCVQTGMHP